jgi:hypothetical protein
VFVAAVCTVVWVLDGAVVLRGEKWWWALDMALIFADGSWSLIVLECGAL